MSILFNTNNIYRKKHIVRELLFTVLILVGSSNLALAQNKKVREDGEPEAATGYQHKRAVTGKDYMVVAAHPYASWVGKKIIKEGGSAIDAAVAIQAMLTLVEPQSSGIGGGTFILYWDNINKKLHTFDGRETAPSGVSPIMFMRDNKPIPWKEAVVGGSSVGVPGVLKALELAHSEFGKLEWQKLFLDAATIAEEGFEVSPRLEKLVALDLHPGLVAFTKTKLYFYPGGNPIKAGYKRNNTKLAKTFRGLAEQGTDYFYKGKLAERIAHAVQNASIRPGKLTKQDIASYRAVKRNPICGQYKKFKICGMAPPSSGGITVYQILKMLESYELEQYKPNQLEAIHLFTQASKLAFADRNAYIADTDFTRLPFAALINQSYLKGRTELISHDSNIRFARKGAAYHDAFLESDVSYDLPNTSHISIVDKEGNAVSMTSSIEFAFGSGLMVEGFLLNNQMTDFSFRPASGPYRILNRIEPGKRPRSSMAPTMVFDENDELILVLGSPGGSRIINYVTQTLIGVLDWNLNIQEAINLPKFTNRNDYTALERGTNLEPLAGSLGQLGHSKLRVIDLNSGIHGIQVVDGILFGGADPRREGIAVGE